MVNDGHEDFDEFNLPTRSFTVVEIIVRQGPKNFGT